MLSPETPQKESRPFLQNLHTQREAQVRDTFYNRYLKIASFRAVRISVDKHFLQNIITISNIFKYIFVPCLQKKEVTYLKAMM